MEAHDDRSLDLLHLHGSEVMRLDEPAAAWLVESGSVAVFGVDGANSHTDGPRRFLFRVEAGRALFGLPVSTEATRATVVAVALEATVLRRATPEQAFAEHAAEWVRDWQRCIDAGATPEDGPGSAAELASFHADLPSRIEGMLTGERRQDGAGIVARQHRAQEVTAEALEQLTSVLQSADEQVPAGSELFVAAALVGRAAGCRLREPSAWELGQAEIDPVELIARVSHVRSRTVVLHEGWWLQDCGALLAFHGAEQRPVALLPRAPGSYLLFDPATRQRIRVDRQIASELHAEAYVFYRPLPEKASSGIELLRFALAGRGRDLALILAAGAAATLLGMFTPQATALLIDHAIPFGDRRLLTEIGFGLGAAALGAAIFRLSQGIALVRLETAAAAATQAAMWDRLLNLRLSFFRGFSTGDLQSRVNAISAIRAFLGGTTIRTLFSAVILLLNLGLLLYYSVTLTLLAAGVALLSATLTIASGVLILRYTREILERRGKLFGTLVQLINGITKLRVAAAEERAFARWAGEYSGLLRLELRERRIQDTVQVINIALSTLSAIALFATAASLLRQPGGLSTGVFLAFNVAYGTFIGAVTSLSNTVTDVLAITIYRERARPILEAVPEVSEAKADPGQLSGRIHLDHATFQYEDDGPTVLDDIDLQIDAGQFVAVVGPSGSGKSTLLRLVLGFESPRSGTVYYDGQDLAALDVHAVRRQMGVVLQTGRINAGSIFDNIVSGGRFTLEDAWSAARATGFADDVRAMPMGMHTVISEGGTNLSGGQRQRLLISRALVHRPRILLLDEATSALDNRTQAIVSASLEQLDVTRVVIAHRLSTIRNADRIYVIEAGHVVQHGTFDELAAQEGLFARLMARQMA